MLAGEEDLSIAVSAKERSMAWLMAMAKPGSRSWSGLDRDGPSWVGFALESVSRAVLEVLMLRNDSSTLADKNSVPPIPSRPVAYAFPFASFAPFVSRVRVSPNKTQVIISSFVLSLV